MEDRNEHNERYGRRTGPYANDYHGNEYDSNDQPQRRQGSPALGFAFRFRLIVVDVCRGGRRVYTSKTITVNF